MKTKLSSVEYFGFTAVDRRFSTAMLPWILLEIRRRGQVTKLCLSVENGCIQSYDVNFELQFSHKIQNIMKLSQIQGSSEKFLYLIKDPNEQLLYCHLYQGSSPEEVSELFNQMKELGSQSGSLRDLRHEQQQANANPPARQMTPQRSSATERAERGPVNTNKGFQSARAQQAAIETSVVQHSRSYNSGLNSVSSPAPSESSAKSLSNASSIPTSKSLGNTANLTSLCADISPCSSHFFEVLYIGKIKVSHKKVPETLIDDALEKFRHLEVEKMKTAQMRRNSLLSSQADSFSESGSHDSLPTKIKSRPLEFKPINIAQDKSISDISLQKSDPIQSCASLISLQSPSVTPLENKAFFAEQSIPKDVPIKHTKEVKENSVDKDFDEFSAVRVQNEIKTQTEKPLLLNKNSIPVALEPKVLILNYTQKEEPSKFSTLYEADVESSKGSMEDDGSDEDSIPDYDKLMHDIKLLGKTEYENITPVKEIQNQTKETVTSHVTEKSVLKTTESKLIQKVEEKAKKKVEFNMNDEYFDKAAVKDIEKESLQARGNLKNLSNRNEPIFSSNGDIYSSNSELKDEGDSKDERKALPVNLPENKSFERDRSASIGTLNLKTPIAQLIGDQNRTMLFQVGRTDLRLISPDRKQVLLHRHLRDVSSCCQGVIHKDHLGFICREPERQDSLVGYVFKCESDGVANDVVGAITQAFVAHAEMVRQGRESSPIFSCEHCPMVWYHKLCQDLEGMADKRIHATILRRLEHLPEDEQNQIITKYQGGTEDLFEVGEHNAFLMMLLRAHCEAKQQRHVHDTAENRSEFLNQYLGGSTIFMKAKRSLSISFDHLLKKKGTKDNLMPNAVTNTKKDISPNAHALTPTRDSTNELHPDIAGSRARNSASMSTENLKDNPTINVSGQNGRRESNPNLNLQLQNSHLREAHESSPSPLLKSPMMDIFMKLGSTPSPKSSSPLNSNTNKNSENNQAGSNSDSEHNTGSWRQAIFNRITREGIGEDYLQGDITDDPAASSGTVLLRRPSSFTNLSQEAQRKRTKEELRELWKKGINQAILLIRMEKENARLKARQEVSAVKRIKLEYEDIGGCANENSKVWDMLTAPKESRLSTKVDSQMLLQAIKHGVPRAKRGDVWYFLAEQYCLRHPPPDIKNFPNYGTPYEVLLKQLTSHQHAILIDLGRTFPNHTYFSSPLGPGQLALFNLLKAYSLLDPEVGYCQGLSFVAGVLLLHLEEAEAFLMLRHLMFRRGLRKQYLPDMAALQVQLYQLSRLVKDHLPELYDKFDQLDVSPTLYAAPWLLTIFTSQFPLGFVTRVFDLLFLESSEVIFRVAVALLDIHKDGLMLCDSFEEIMEYLKHKIPNIDKIMLDKVIKLAFTLDFGRQLHEYKVEYNVLQEEMAAIAPKMEALTKLEKQNEKLQLQNQQILEQLEEAMTKTLTTQKTNNKLELQIKSLEQTVAALVRFIGTTHDKKKDSELPNDIRKLCQQVQQNDKKTLGALGQKLGQNFSSKFVMTDFSNGSPNVSGMSEESSSDPEEKIADKNRNKHGLLKSHLSTSNIFSKMSDAKKEDLQKQFKDDPNLEKKRQYLSMKKSMSCNAGLMIPKEQVNKENQIVSKINNNLKGYPLKVLDEDTEHFEIPKAISKNKNLEILKSSKLSNASTISSLSSLSNLDSPKSKGSGFFAHTQEQIRQEKLQAEQLKQNFDDNLKRLDARLSPNVSYHDKSISSPISHSLFNPAEVSEKLASNLSKNDHSTKEIKSNGDSGIGTPMSPNEKCIPIEDKTTKNIIVEDALASHPLVGCDLDIKFDVHSTKLKSLKSSKVVPIRPMAIDTGDSRN